MEQMERILACYLCKNKPIVQALKNIPKGRKEGTEWLVKEHFCSKFRILKFYITIQSRSNRNA
ncbi:hypothetical protein H5410_038614 [Solanum commersonii]|uniref:Uncharacterized protein n=1 Tax=Solanum commersonii TaxID=4109 RepID=A0A9J5YEF4_SOLCO|nr:hypothetical protein H5410_038614 [Solanum commersonii]